MTSEDSYQLQGNELLQQIITTDSHTSEIKLLVCVSLFEP